MIGAPVRRLAIGVPRGGALEAAGVAWTGYDSDQSANFPDEWLTAAVYNWGPYYLQQYLREQSRTVIEE